MSFLNRLEYDDLDTHLCKFGDKRLAFGGFLIIFAGDFCQFEPFRSTSEQLLFLAAQES